jgi:TusA-related sulfurtransferase
MSPSNLPAQKLQVDQSLDVRGVERGAAFAQARERLQGMAEEQILELHLDEGDALNSIPYGLRADGHELLVSEPVQTGVRLLVRKRSLLP